MINFIHAKSIVKNIYFWIYVWMLLVALYVLSLKYSFHIVEVNYAVYLLQLLPRWLFLSVCSTIYELDGYFFGVERRGEWTYRKT